MNDTIKLNEDALKSVRRLKMLVWILGIGSAAMSGIYWPFSLIFLFFCVSSKIGSADTDYQAKIQESSSNYTSAILATSSEEERSKLFAELKKKREEIIRNKKLFGDDGLLYFSVTGAVAMISKLVFYYFGWFHK